MRRAEASLLRKSAGGGTFRSTVLAIALALPLAAAAQQPAYRNASLPIDRRIDDLLSRMTLEEKVGQIRCVWDEKKQIANAAGEFDPARAPKWFRTGIGRIERPQDGHDARSEAQ